MFAEGRLSELRRRKELLLTQAGTRRRLVELEVRGVATSLRWVEGAYNLAQRARLVAVIAAPLLGFWLMRGRKPIWRWTLLGFDLWRKLRVLGR